MMMFAALVLSLIGCSMEHSIDMLRQESRQLLSTQDDICVPRRNKGCEKLFEEDYPSPLHAEHKCEDYIQRDRGDESEIFTLIEKDLSDPKLWGSLRGPQKFLYHIKGKNPGEEFLFCSTPKTGSTRLRLFFMRIQGLQGRVQNASMWTPTHLQLYPISKQLELLKDPNIKRIRMVRDPYIRAISMYLDKATLHTDKSFDDWVAFLYDNTHHISAYFIPQQDFCLGKLGFKFDHIVKVERQNYWMPCFIENFNLWRYFMTGWSAKDQCYMSTKDVPCNGPYQNDDGQLIYPETDLGHYSDGVHVSHNTDSASKLREYYKNETTAMKITELFLEDIVQYNYQFYPHFM